MCSMNDLDWRRDSLINHGIEDGANPQGGGCGNYNLVCQCFQCAAVNATKVEAASIGKGNANISALEPYSNRITCGRVCASAPTSRYQYYQIILLLPVEIFSHFFDCR